MERNIELLQKTMQHIIDHPETHDQGLYWNQCGTPSCFAGWAVHFSGMTLEEVYASSYQTTGTYASHILGLTVDEGVWSLFNAGNTVPMLELMVKDLVNGDQLRDTESYRTEAEGAHHVPRL